jgi:hypothetical protein
MKDVMTKSKFFATLAVVGLGSVFAYGCAMQHDAKLLGQSFRAQEAYLVDYVKNDPTMASAVDRYFTCVERKVKAYEGCLNYATTQPTEKEKLATIVQRFSEEMTDLDKKLLVAK